MSQEIQLPTTQRAYTLRLRGVPDDDGSWREALWATHETLNKGAKVFGDWLLTLRGGLCHTLADELADDGKNKPERDPAANGSIRKNRRILLALSWLCVEDERGAPLEFIAAYGDKCKGVQNTQDERDDLVLKNLRGILRDRHLQCPEIDSWCIDCKDSLHALIRDDAVWVNRSKCFDSVTSGWDVEKVKKARGDAKRIIWWILAKKDYLLIPKPPQQKERHQKTSDEESGKDSGAGAGHRTRYTYGHIFENSGGVTGKSDDPLELRECWADYLRTQINLIRAIVPKEEARKKKPKGCVSPTELHRQMFSKAASRLAQIWTKQRQQEADRQARQQADVELKKMEDDTSFQDALTALTLYCEKFGLESGAMSAFRIRPAQVMGWDRVVERWEAIEDTDVEALEKRRIEEVKKLQDADPESKFGDPNLFLRLAREEFRPTWRHLGETNPQILKWFVAGMKARSDAQRLKVAAYRHPEAYLNPVFCEFGNDLPDIELRRLDARGVELDLVHPDEKKWAKTTKLYAVSQRFDQEIWSARHLASNGNARLPMVSRRSRLGSAAAGLQSSDAPVRMPALVGLKPNSKKRASTDDDRGQSEMHGHKKKKHEWSGKLFTRRRDLVAIRKLLDRAENEPDADKRTQLQLKANVRRGQLKWWIIVPAKLEGRGPWFDYVDSLPDKTPFERTVRKDESGGLERKKGIKYINAEGWPWEEFNKPLKEKETDKRKPGEAPSLIEDTPSTRGGKACLILSRLPGLRVLSVDLGLRYGAACAVWEAISTKQFEEECLRAQQQGAIIKRIEGDDLYVHLLWPERESNRATKKRRTEGRVKRFQPLTVFRRIGPNTVTDPKTEMEQPHPAPWARLDRQFVIKLQGEDRAARAALQTEQDRVQKFVETFGLSAEDEKEESKRVDKLMARAIRIESLALRRHGRRAKIAYALDPATQVVYGIGGQPTEFVMGDPTHIKLLTEALFDWHALATDGQWDDAEARRAWNLHISQVEGGWPLELPKTDPTVTDDRTRPQRKKDEEELRVCLKSLAESLATANRHLMHDAWKTRWQKDDGEPLFIRYDEVNGKKIGIPNVRGQSWGWHADLRWITDWIMGWHLPGASEKNWKWMTGGLSLSRIANLQGLYRLQKAFAMRPRPNNPRGAPQKGESNFGIAQSILDALDQLREQRSKQLASRIVEAALGIGSENREKHWEEGTKRPRGLLFWIDEHGHEHGERRFAPCHSIVMERLDDYKPDEVRSRRENRLLASWRKAELKKRLAEACQLHGLHLREVMPKWTSQQDSRTGFPGVRCDDVTVENFLTASWWNKAVNAARRKTKDKSSSDPLAQFLVDLREVCDKVPQRDRKSRTVRVPQKGGDLFVAAYPDLTTENHRPHSCLQADLNAAANIGLRALLDPDFRGKWWYVLCREADGVPVAEKVKGSACFGAEPASFVPLRKPEKNLKERAMPKGGKAKKKKGEVVNLWADPLAFPQLCAETGNSWRLKSEYWASVRERVVELLRLHNGLPPLNDANVKPDKPVDTPW